jgi:hypothetical protein
MGPARSSRHGPSSCAASSPLSGRKSTYRPVQISQAGSVLRPRIDTTFASSMLNAKVLEKSGAWRPLIKGLLLDDSLVADETTMMLPAKFSYWSDEIGNS